MTQETEHEAVIYNYAEMIAAFDLKPFCYLVALDNWAISLILSSLRYAHWVARWTGFEGYDFKDIYERVIEVEDCLMSGCDISQLISALNDGFDKLADGLTSVVSQTTVVNPGCTSGGTELPSEDGQEGGDPPQGYAPPSGGTLNRKCKVSNFIFDSVVSIITKLKIVDADEWGAIGFVLASGIVGAILGSQVPVAGTLIGAVAGTIASVVVMLITGGVSLDLDDISAVLAANQGDLVCALYGATKCSEARVNFLSVLGEGGLTWTERQLCGLCLPNRLLNLLFFSILYYEETIDGWECTIDCSTCEAVSELRITLIPGSEAGTIERDGNDYTVYSEEDPYGRHRANFQCCQWPDLEDLRCAEISSWSTDLTYWPDIDNWVMYCDESTGFLPKPFEQADIQGFKQLALCSWESFTVTFTLVGEWEP